MHIPGYSCNIGLEIHVQLNTKTKAFCRDINQFGEEANTNISELSLGYPGTLPMVNRSHIISAIKLGKALNCKISEAQYFDRKNYHYPDLPKAYQITQDNIPVCIGGEFTFISEEKEQTIQFHHIHCEEDAGKNIHDISDEYSLLDYNRAGTPLLEMVTEPDFTSAKQVHDFLAELQRLVRYLEISDANMEEGSMRCDCNISIKPENSYKLGTRVEVKNLNSKKFAQQAITYEAERQFALIENGESIIQQSRLWDSGKNKTFAMRDKENVNDYRYFPDPDIQPIILESAFIENIQSSVIHTPQSARKDLIENYKLSLDQVEQLVDEKNNYLYFLHINDVTQKAIPTANFVINQALPYIKANKINHLDYPISVASIKEILEKIDNKEISSSNVYQSLIPFLMENKEATVESAIKQLGIAIESNGNEIEALVNKVLSENPDKVKAYQSGKKGLIGFFMGQAMRHGGKKMLPDELKAAFEKGLS